MITAFGASPSLDVTYVVDELRGIQRPLEVHRVAGGKALNAARAAARLGADVTGVTVLGGGTGQVVADAARAERLPLEVVGGDGLTRTCVSVLDRSTGRLTEIYEHPTPVSATLLATLVERLREVLASRPGWCLVAGGVPEPAGAAGLVDALRAGREAGALLAVDSHGPALRRALEVVRVDVLKVNRAEAAELCGRPASDDLTAVVAELQRRAADVVVVTDGMAGALATDGTALVRAVLPEPVGRFPVGSGDSFLGGLVLGLDAGEDLPTALRLATACGTANALVPGAARFDAAVARALSAEVEVRGEA